MTYRAEDRATWDDIFRTVPDEWFTAGPSDAMVRCLAFFRPQSVRRLLDVGAGVGRWAAYLARNGIGPIVALDYAYHGCRAATDWARRERLAVTAVVGDAVDAPFADRVFDGILAALVLENLNPGDRRLAVAHLRRISTRGAHAFFLFNPVPTEADAGASPSDNPTRRCHIEPCTDEEIASLLIDWRTLDRGTTEESFRFVAAVKV